jgi:hypothetical protein
MPFHGERLSACHPNPNLEGKSTECITPGAGCPSYTPATGAGCPSYTPATGYPFWSSLTTCMGCSRTILFPDHHTGKVTSYVSPITVFVQIYFELLPCNHFSLKIIFLFFQWMSNLRYKIRYKKVLKLFIHQN